MVASLSDSWRSRILAISSASSVSLLARTLGATTVSNDLLFTTLYDGVLTALNRQTGAIVYRRQLPTSTNSPIALAGNTVIVPAGGPVTSSRGGDPQVVAYTIR